MLLRKKTNKILLKIFFLASFFFGNNLNAQPLTLDGGNMTGRFANKAGFKEAPISVNEVIGQVITAFLGLIATIFIVLMVYAGYNWMTAAGDEEKVTKAKNSIKRAIIGLVITVLAYTITYFIFTNIPDSGPNP